MAKTSKKTAVRAPVPVTLTGEVWRPATGSQSSAGPSRPGLFGGWGKPRYGVWGLTILLMLIALVVVGRWAGKPAPDVASSGSTARELASPGMALPAFVPATLDVSSVTAGPPPATVASGTLPAATGSVEAPAALGSAAAGHLRADLPRSPARPPEQPRIPPRFRPPLDPSGENPYPPEPISAPLPGVVASPEASSTIAALPAAGQAPGSSAPPATDTTVAQSPILPAAPTGGGPGGASPQAPVVAPSPTSASLASPAAAMPADPAKGGERLAARATPSSQQLPSLGATPPSVSQEPSSVDISPSSRKEISGQPSPEPLPPSPVVAGAERASEAVPTALPIPGDGGATPLGLPPEQVEPPRPAERRVARSWRDELEGPLTPDFTREEEGPREVPQAHRPPRSRPLPEPVARPSREPATERRDLPVAPRTGPAPAPTPAAPAVSRWARLAAQADPVGGRGRDDLAGPVVPALAQSGGAARATAPDERPVVPWPPRSPSGLMTAARQPEAPAPPIPAVPVLERSGEPLLGLRAVLEPAGWTLVWINRRRGVRGRGPGGATLALVPGQRRATVSGQTMVLSTAPVLAADGRVFVPRDLLEALQPGRPTFSPASAPAPKEEGRLASVSPQEPRRTTLPAAPTMAPRSERLLVRSAGSAAGPAMVEVRRVLEADGWSVLWAGPRHGAVCRKGPGRLLIVVPGDPIVRWNGASLSSDPPPVWRRGKMFLPATVLEAVLGRPVAEE